MEELLASLPNSKTLEDYVLAAIIIDQECSNIVWSITIPQAFHNSSNYTIALACFEMYADGEYIDIATLSNYLDKNKKLDDIGGLYYLTKISDSIVSSANVKEHAKKLHEVYEKREFIRETFKAAYGVSQGKEINEVLPNLDKVLFRPSSESESTAKEAVYEWLDHIDKVKAGGFEISTGIQKIDNYIGGFDSGELAIIAARPSVGKSALLYKIISHNSIHNNKKCGIFSLETEARWVVGRTASLNAMIDMHDFSHANLEIDDWRKADAELSRISRAELYICDNPSITLTEIRATAKKWKKERNIDYLVLDYLQLVTTKGGSRTEEIETISRGLKQIARENKIPVIALSQLSRASEIGHTTPRKPRLSDLRGSGAIEQDADVVIMLHRFPLESDEADAIIAKQRNGPVGDIKVRFINHCGLYTD